MTNVQKEMMDYISFEIKSTKAELEALNKAMTEWRLAISRGEEVECYAVACIKLEILEEKLESLQRIAAKHSILAEMAAKMAKSTPETKQEETTAEQKEQPAKKTKAAAKFSPVAVFLDGGESKLTKELENLDIPELKDIIREYSLDKTGNYRRWKDRGRLEELILRRSEQKATRGDVFRIFTSDIKNAYTA